jgi:uncharacterized glyoxalase superfamily protein PhnB
LALTVVAKKLSGYIEPPSTAISMQMMYADGAERFGTLKDRFGKAWMVAV